MRTFNYQKFIKEGQAETMNGEHIVVRHFIKKNGIIYVTLKSLKDSAGLTSQNYNKEGHPVSMYGTTYPNMQHINLVNE